MKHARRIAIAALGLCLGCVGTVGCNGATAEAAAGAGDKQGFQDAAALLKRPIALIAAYKPHLQAPESKDAYTPKKRPELERAGTAAAGEIRFAANGARQKLKADNAAL